MPSRVFMICNAYESGFGHGLASDGMDLSKTPHSDPELGEAYQIGYDAGQKAKSPMKLTEAINANRVLDRFCLFIELTPLSHRDDFSSQALG